MEDIEKADKFYRTHGDKNKEFLWPRHLFEKVVKEHNGYLPLRIEALPEGTVIQPHTPVYQITAEGEYSKLCTFLETILTHVWYPTCVATLSRMAKQIIQIGFEKSVDEEWRFLLHGRLHDFGFRGCTCVEQSVLGGTAHLLNFIGSDTMSAAYYSQFHLNNGNPVAQSIPATEHSVMTAWRTEEEAIRNMIDKFGTGIYSIVMDSYDYTNALKKILPKIAPYKKSKGGYFVIRPDSGDPTEAVLEALEAADAVFGSQTNKKGYKILQGAGVIQGDGINITTLEKIQNAVLEKGYSAQNV
jgi:nicotinic acid phosphoribosyltransferase